ncbi:MAG TPA: amino acid ABC transporter permease [Acidimicrobiales bacterium]|nr:amino acid ABC transporter permease [Acidimicrobiales bacterium]
MTEGDPVFAGSTVGGTNPEVIEAIPVRHRGRWVAAAIILVLIAQFIHWLVTDHALEWDVVWHYLFSDQILTGVVNTIKLTIIAMLIGVALGVVLAVMRLSKNPIVSGVSWIYIWFFRGTPVLVQLIFWYNLPTVLRSISLGVPFGPSWFAHDPKDLISTLVAVCLGLGLNEAAYMAEIARAGILSVSEGQVEAASALGMTRLQSMRRIVLPQAMRVIIPPTGNETISMLKTTSLAVFVSYNELLGAATNIYSRTYQTIPLLITASIWYLILTSILTVGQYYLERYYARGAQRELPPTPLQKLRWRLTRREWS